MTSRTERLWQRAMYRREAAGQRERILSARVVFWLAGKLYWIRVSQRMYQVVWDTEPGDPDPRFHTVPSEKMKMAVVTNRLLSFSMHSAWDHWSHFALDHSGCEQVHEICSNWRCRHPICPDRPDDLDE